MQQQHRVPHGAMIRDMRFEVINEVSSYQSPADKQPQMPHLIFVTTQNIFRNLLVRKAMSKRSSRGGGEDGNSNL